MEKSASDDTILPHVLTDIERQYVNAVAGGITDPVMVVFDIVRDERAQRIVSKYLGEHAVANAIAHADDPPAAGRMKPPLLISAWPLADAKRCFSELAGVERIDDFIVNRRMTILIVAENTWRWIGAPRPNDLPAFSYRVSRLPEIESPCLVPIVVVEDADKQES